MGGEPTNGRTHEPNLREVVADLDGLRDLMHSEDQRIEAVMDERHERYGERAKAAEDRVGVAFNAAKEASAKSDEAQKIYNEGHNDRLPRLEAEGLFRSVRSEIDQVRKDVQGLRESRSQGTGERLHEVTATQRTQWSTGVIISTILGSIAVLLSFTAVVSILLRHP